jgi:hypothetical protein
VSTLPVLFPVHEHTERQQHLRRIEKGGGVRGGGDERRKGEGWMGWAF